MFRIRINLQHNPLHPPMDQPFRSFPRHPQPEVFCPGREKEGNFPNLFTIPRDPAPGNGRHARNEIGMVNRSRKCLPSPAGVPDQKNMLPIDRIELLHIRNNFIQSQTATEHSTFGSHQKPAPLLGKPNNRPVSVRIKKHDNWIRNLLELCRYAAHL